MPKLIDYPRTSYTGAWELAEIVDDTGGKCAIDTAAKKLNRKVSGSFKAIIGSAVKFGLMTSKRELLTTTTLFRRIKHAYDKAEELQFHREAFLTPPLFTQLCRKFRNRELPVQMLDVMLIREFGVEEINAQGVAKAFVDGCRMCGLIDERNIIADIDALSTNRPARRELSSTPQPLQSFVPNAAANLGTDEPKTTPVTNTTEQSFTDHPLGLFSQPTQGFIQAQRATETLTKREDAVASLFGLPAETNGPEPEAQTVDEPTTPPAREQHTATAAPVHAAALAATGSTIAAAPPAALHPQPLAATGGYQMQMSGPGVNTSLDISDEADLAIAMALLEKIRRQLRAGL